MKKHLFLILSFFLVMVCSTPSFANDNLDLDGGTVLLVQEKDGNVGLVFTLPDYLFDITNNELTTPLLIDILDDAGNVFATTSTLSPFVSLSSVTFAQGQTYTLNYSIGNVSGTEKLSW